MKNKILILALIAALSACSGGNPFDTPDEGTDGGGTPGETPAEGEGTGINRDGIPPGTASPAPSDALFRSEIPGDEDTDKFGNGRAKNISYNSEDDTFSVDDLAFDGDGPYTRGRTDIDRDGDGNNDGVSSLNGGLFAVYEAPTVALDPNNDNLIGQLVYRAVYGVSENRIVAADGTVTESPTTQFAIVRTGSYVDYGFGGFIYQRDNGVSLPNTLQATYSGKSAGLRDYNNLPTGGLQYTTADVTLDIDFDDFNDNGDVRGDGVKGQIFNRRVLDLLGEDVTSTVAAELFGDEATRLPDLLFKIGPDVLDSNGDLVADIQTPDGVEAGKFYAIVAGEGANEVVGVFVAETSGGESQSRDTSGFILYRDNSALP